MARLSKKLCIELVKKDASIIEKYATTIMIIAPDNESFELIHNPINPRIGILAVIGPTDSSDDQKFRPDQIMDEDFKQAILLEIGLGSNRPYKRIKNKKDHIEITKRRKWFCLTKKQYKLIAPHIFSFILKNSLRKIRTWKRKGYTRISGPKSRWVMKKKLNWELWKDRPKGTRFSVSLKDNFVLRDVFWTELNNKQIIFSLEGLANSIDMTMRIRRYKKNYKGKRLFQKLKGARDILEDTKEIHIRLKNELLEKFIGRNYLFYNQLRNLFELPKEVPESKIAKKAERLPNPKERTGNIQLRITKNGGLRKDRDYIVFEVSPHDLLTKDEINSILSTGNDDNFDDIPF